MVASSKDVIPTIAAGAAGVGAGSAIAYFVGDYRHTSQRNSLRRSLATQFAQSEGERLQLQKQLEQSSATISQLQADLQVADIKYGLLAETADAEVQRLRALVPADAVSTNTPTDAVSTDTPIDPIVSTGSVTEAPPTAEPATVS